MRVRQPELERLERLLSDVRTGESQVLVIRGEAGIGRSTLLEHLVEQASECRVARAAGVQAEAELTFAGLHQLCLPLLDRIPAPQRDALRTAFGLQGGPHALAQVDGAAVFDADGVLRSLGVRLVPSPAAEQSVEAFRGTRHMSGRRYSRDDPRATVIAVSEDGPVSVLRAGAISAAPTRTNNPTRDGREKGLLPEG